MGHGHVVPNEDGSRARCGGPPICKVCALEAAQFAAEMRPSIIVAVVDENDEGKWADILPNVDVKVGDKLVKYIDPDPQPLPLIATCRWSSDGGDDDGGAFSSECHNMFNLNEGNPVENGMKFCLFCGKVLEFIPYVQEPDEDEDT